MAINFYSRFEHAVFVFKKQFPFPLAISELKTYYFYDKHREANLFLAIITAPIYWRIEYSLRTDDARRTWEKSAKSQYLGPRCLFKK